MPSSFWRCLFLSTLPARPQQQLRIISGFRRLAAGSAVCSCWYDIRTSDTRSEGSNTQSRHRIVHSMHDGFAGKLPGLPQKPLSGFLPLIYTLPGGFCHQHRHRSCGKEKDRWPLHVLVTLRRWRRHTTRLPHWLPGLYLCSHGDVLKQFHALCLEILRSHQACQPQALSCHDLFARMNIVHYGANGFALFTK